MDSQLESQSPTTSKFADRLASLERYRKFLPAAFFVAGFLFDIITLSRIDDVLSIFQQALYLTVIIGILRHRYLESKNLWAPVRPLIVKIWQYNDEILHFLFGSLLSLYTLFYFVSASLATSFGFMAAMAVILVMNELPRFQKQGLQIKFALFAVCLSSFLFCLVPMALGFIGYVPFILSLVVGGGLIWSIYYDINKKHPDENNRKALLLPPGIVAGVLILLYVMKALPPIPLSAQYIGIYHDIERVKVDRPGQEPEVKYVLKYERTFWKFWQNGAQSFVARPGDRIFCFVRIFSPANFKDEVVYHWLKKTPKGWQTHDKITNTISGGRDEGFRGYVYKSNFEDGDWRVQVETKDGREIGRIGFTVEKAEADPNREFEIDQY